MSNVHGIQRDSDMTVAEVAAELKVHPQTVRGWIKAGAIHTVQIGLRSHRVPVSSLDDFKARGGVRPVGRPKKETGNEQANSE